MLALRKTVMSTCTELLYLNKPFIYISPTPYIGTFLIFKLINVYFLTYKLRQLKIVWIFTYLLIYLKFLCSSLLMAKFYFKNIYKTKL